MCQKGEINGLSIIVNHQLYSEKKKSERVENVELIISFFISRITLIRNMRGGQFKM